MPEYKFFQATIVVDGSTLTIRRGVIRDPALPKEASIPLTRVTGGHVTMPKGWSNGHLQVYVRGAVERPLTTKEAAQDRFTVLFLDNQGSKDRAQQLCAWLNQIGRHNLTTMQAAAPAVPIARPAHAGGAAATPAARPTPATPATPGDTLYARIRVLDAYFDTITAAPVDLAAPAQPPSLTASTPAPAGARPAALAAPGAPLVAPATGPLSEFDLWGTRGTCTFPVPSESGHQSALRAALGPDLDPDQAVGQVPTTATLHLNAGPRSGTAAVEVRIEGRQVGLFSAADSARYAPVLDGLTARGRVARVPGVITWTQPPGRRATFGVRLDLGEPDRIVPANDLPPGPCVLIPVGRAIEIQDEDKHMAAIRTVLARPALANGGAPVYATLSEFVRPSGRGAGRSLVEVSIDGQRVGELTPKMSDTMLSVVRFAAEYGVTLACRGQITGNLIAAEVVVHPARANEIPGDVLNRIVALGGARPPGA